MWIAALDVEKALDKVHHLKILEGLIGKGMDTDIVLAIRSMYTDLHAFVQLWHSQLWYERCHLDRIGHSNHRQGRCCECYGGKW